MEYIRYLGEVNDIPCRYYMLINTRWACAKPYTTQEPVTDCIWKSPNGTNTIDLKPFQNETIIGASDTDDHVFYRYSPCRNGLSCKGGSDGKHMNHMVDTFDIVNMQCSHNLYLAQWQASSLSNVHYDAKDKKWQFIYTNGQMCNGFKPVTTIIWSCNPSTSSATIIKARETALCQHVVEIESSVACT